MRNIFTALLQWWKNQERDFVESCRKEYEIPHAPLRRVVLLEAKRQDDGKQARATGSGWWWSNSAYDQAERRIINQLGREWDLTGNSKVL